MFGGTFGISCFAGLLAFFFLFLKLTRYEWLIFHCSAYCNGECFKKKKV
uniref:Uncharacterized protein n=1 Tax=Mus musculus TaxID=10090 RepID=Q3UR13_MOUSE|nr:unnamed protein product [Mus musculus]